MPNDQKISAILDPLIAAGVLGEGRRGQIFPPLEFYQAVFPLRILQPRPFFTLLKKSH